MRDKRLEKKGTKVEVGGGAGARGGTQQAIRPSSTFNMYILS
jgi:hypothetical protein